MKCSTASKGSITAGIKLWCDAPLTPNDQAKYFLHLPDNFFMAISDAVLQSDCVNRDGNDVILMRCSITKNREIIPETPEDALHNQMFVLGSIDGKQVMFSEENPQPAHYRTAIGSNTCCQWLFESRQLNRGPNGYPTAVGHEEFHFLAVMKDCDRIEANVIFYNEDGSAIKLRAHGCMFSYHGEELSYHYPLVERTL